MKLCLAKRIVAQAAEMRVELRLLKGYTGRCSLGRVTVGVIGWRYDIQSVMKVMGLEWDEYFCDTLSRFDVIVY